MYDPYASFTKSVLSNGLEVHSVYWDRPWIKVGIVVHTGSREDPLHRLGLAHIVEHLVAQNIPGCEFDDARKFFDAVGGNANFGVTYYSATRYKFAVPAKVEAFRKALEIYGKMMFQARIEKDIDRERKVIEQEFNDHYMFNEKFEWDIAPRRALFRGHRLEHYECALGEPKGFLSATKEDFQLFYDEHYVPHNVSLVVLGGFQTEQIISELERSPFGTLKKGTRNPIPAALSNIKLPTENEKVIKMSDYVSVKVDQLEYKAKWAMPATFPRQARRVFDEILGKVLLDEIREKRGATYHISTDYTNFQDVYEYEICGIVNPRAKGIIGGLVRDCIAQAASDRDLFDMKLNSIKQRWLMDDHSGGSILSDVSRDLVSDQRVITQQEITDGLNKVSFEQMAEAASFLSPERQFTFITRP